MLPMLNQPLSSGLDAESQVVYGEDRSELALLQKEYTEYYQPMTPPERFQVDTLIRNEWTLRRLFRAEAQLWEHHAIKSSVRDGVPLGEGFDRASDVFMRMQRRITLAERSYQDALVELGRLQSGRAQQPQPAQPESEKRAAADPATPAKARPPRLANSPVPAAPAPPSPAAPETRTPAGGPASRSRPPSSA